MKPAVVQQGGRVTARATPVFFANAAAESQIVLDRGGARSSKSYSIAQLFLTRFLTEQRKSFLVVRKTLPSLRLSTYAMMRRICDDWGVWSALVEERQHLNWHRGRSLLHFGSLDDPEKIKSTDWNYIWMEEATEFTYDDFQILKMRLSAPSPDGRPNQLFASFNPVDEFSWIKQRVVDGAGEDWTEVASNYRCNPFLSGDYVRTLLALERQDPNYFNIYTLGRWGRLDNLIFGAPWDVVESMPPRAGRGMTVYGVDFGFNDPTVLLEVAFVDGELWVDELLYETGLTTGKLVERIRAGTELAPPIPVEKNDYMFCDSAEPDRIEELSNQHLFNAHPCEKGPGSVKASIELVKGFVVHVTSRSVNLLKEKTSYAWKRDRNGRTLDEPIEFNDHAMSALRYAVYSWHRLIGGVGPMVSIVDMKGR